MRGRAFRGWIILSLLAGLLAWHYRLPGLLYYALLIHTQDAQARSASVWLPQYRVTIEALPIEGLARNASDLAFNAETGTLFAAINRPAQIAELSTEGRLLRLIPVAGAADLEAIAHVQGELYLVADERSSELHRVRIGPDTAAVEIGADTRLDLSIRANRYFGVEGLGWDVEAGRLFIAQERLPRRLLAVEGVRAAGSNETLLQARDWKPAGRFALFLADLSAVTVAQGSGSLLMLSDDSALVVEYGRDGRPASIMPLWPGFHGLSAFVPQAEGIALGPDGTIYLLSEPNLFYRFERAQPPAWPVRTAKRDEGDDARLQAFTGSQP